MALPLLWHHEQSSNAPQGVIKEDLLNMLTNISPRDTPFLSGINRAPCGGVYHEWPRKSLAARATGASFAIEGAAWTGKDMPTTTRDWNLCGILKNEFWISGTAQAVDQVVSDRLALEIEDAVAELANALEVALFLSTYVAGSGTAARSWGGVFQFVTTNVATATATVNWDEASFSNLLQTCWTQGGKPNECYLSPYFKRELMSWVPTSGRRQVPMSDRRLTLPIDVVDTDFGPMSFFKSRDLSGSITPASTPTYAYGGFVAILEMSKFRWAVLRSLTERLSKDGDRTRGHALVEGTLEVLAEESSARTQNACFDY